jgi:hypothetical protein
MLAIRLTDVAEETEPQFLLCTSVRRLEADPSWLVQDLRCRSIDEDTLVVDDKQSAFHVTCHALRIFNAEEFTHWVGADPDIVSPTPNSFQTILRRSAKAS